MVKQHIRQVSNLRRTGILAAWAAVIALAGVMGCQQAGPGETNRKISNVGPIFNLDKAEGVNEDGTTWKKEKGDACCWLISWEKEKKYDKDGFLVYRKEKDFAIPLLSGSELEETKEVYMKKGTLLLFPYYTRRAKTIGEQ